MIGCGDPQRNAQEEPREDSTRVAAQSIPDAERGIVLFVGTSLTAGFGLQPAQSFPARIQEKIDSAGLPFIAVNAGVSGETSAAALRRLDWLTRQEFDVLVLETGANDMLRGFDVASTRESIEAIVERVHDEHPDARIVIAGMLAAPNLGRTYGDAFRSMYSEIAEARDLSLVPFLLQDVAAVPELNQGDGIHPNVEGQRRVAANVWTVLEPVLREVAEEKARGESS